MGGQEMDAIGQHPGAEAVKHNVVFENENAPGARPDSSAETFQVRFINPPLIVDGVLLHDDEFHPDQQADASELPFSLLPTVFALVQRDAVDSIEETPEGGKRWLSRSLSHGEFNSVRFAGRPEQAGSG
jgi:hypothetical protein